MFFEAITAAGRVSLDRKRLRKAFAVSLAVHVSKPKAFAAIIEDAAYSPHVATS